VDADVLDALESALSAETEHDAEDWLARVLSALENHPHLRGPVSFRLLGSARSSLSFCGAELAAEDHRARGNVCDRLAEGLWADGARETSHDRRERLLRLPEQVVNQALRSAALIADQEELRWVASVSQDRRDPGLADALLLAISRAEDPALIRVVCSAAARLLRDGGGHRLHALEALASRRPDLAGVMVEAAVACQEPRTIAAVALVLGGTLLSEEPSEEAFAGALAGLLSLPQIPARDHALAAGIDQLGPVASRRVYDGVARVGAQEGVAGALARRIDRSKPGVIRLVLRRVASLHPPTAAEAARGHIDHHVPEVRVYCVDVLGRCGSTRDLPLLRKVSRGLFVVAELKQAASAAIAAIEERSRTGGELSIAPDFGAVAIAPQGSGLALDED
jgi:hypothetical protein